MAIRKEARDAESAGELRAAVGREVAALAGWAATVSFEDMPERIRRRAALVLCDDIAAIVAARNEPEVVRLQDQLTATPGVAEATVLNGGRRRADRYAAAVANGAAADWCELDEGYRKVICHAGLYSVPALLAEAEARPLTAAETLRALVIGYEVATRFAHAFTFPGLTLHPHASLAAVGAAAATAAARRVSAERFRDSLTSASTMVAPGPYNHAVQGGLVRNVWPAAGAWCGMRAVDWAGFGIAGLPESPYDVFAGAFGASVEPKALTAGLGREWGIESGYHKIHACCQYSHSAVEATLELRPRLPEGWSPDGVERIRIETHWRGLTLDNRAPATTLAAKFSMPHIAAVTALYGHAGAEAFAGSTLRDATVAALRARVELAPFEPELPWPNDRPARVAWRLADGTGVQAECLSARGGPDRPFAPEEIARKIAGITTPAYPAMPAVIDRLLALDPAILAERWDTLVFRMVRGAAA